MIRRDQDPPAARGATPHGAQPEPAKAAPVPPPRPLREPAPARRHPVLQGDLILRYGTGRRSPERRLSCLETHTIGRPSNGFSPEWGFAELPPRVLARFSRRMLVLSPSRSGSAVRWRALSEAKDSLAVELTTRGTPHELSPNRSVALLPGSETKVAFVERDRYREERWSAWLVVPEAYDEDEGTDPGRPTSGVDPLEPRHAFVLALAVARREGQDWPKPQQLGEACASVLARYPRLEARLRRRGSADHTKWIKNQQTDLAKRLARDLVDNELDPFGGRRFAIATADLRDVAAHLTTYGSKFEAANLLGLSRYDLAQESGEVQLFVATSNDTGRFVSGADVLSGAW
jgi:hypothetical protein